MLMDTPPPKSRRTREKDVKRKLWERTRWQFLGDESAATEEEKPKKAVKFELPKNDEKRFRMREVEDFLRAKVREIKEEVERNFALQQEQQKWDFEKKQLAFETRLADLNKQLDVKTRAVDDLQTRVHELECEVAEEADPILEGKEEQEEPFCSVCGAEWDDGSDDEVPPEVVLQRLQAADSNPRYMCYGDCGVWAHLSCIQQEPAKFTRRGLRYRSFWLGNGPGLWCPECEDPALDKGTGAKESEESFSKMIKKRNQA